MSTSWKAQITNGDYRIQFETDNYEYYEMVEKACQQAMDKRDKAINKERCSRMRTMGHL
jgi:hypothetical protein